MVSDKAKKIIFKLLIFILALPLVYYASRSDSATIFPGSQEAIFVLSIIIVLFLPRFRRMLSFFILGFFIAMIGFYSVKWQEGADFAGSTAFGLTIIIVFSYLKEILKKGYIKDFNK